MIHPYNRLLRQPARNLRRRMTEAERCLWSRLRRKQILDVQFYRQKPLGNYIVDFYAPRARLVIEVDGTQHLEPEGRERDRLRTAYLERRGVRVVRFGNAQVLTKTHAVLADIRRTVERRLSRR